MSLSAEDRLAIIDLIADYALRVDGGDVEGYVANFTPDAVIDYTNGRCEGHDEIRRWVGRLVEIGQVGSDPAKLRHVLGMPQVSGDGDRAHARTYVMIPGKSEDGSLGVPLVGTYTDDVVKLDGRWRFARREIGMNLVGPGRREASRD
jgi:ketosteroid isomerase-like protein